MRRLLVCCLLLTGCGSVSETYSQADRTTFDAVAPEYLKYVEMDASLSEERRNRRRRTIETWKRRLETAEGKR